MFAILKNKYSFSGLIIIIYAIAIPIMDISFSRYSQKEGVIKWDVKSYYAYLPAAIIHGDLSLGFYDENIKKYGKWIWPECTPSGNKTVLTTMGLSFMYSPFFLTGHAYALVNNKYEADGYSLPYHVALTFSVYVYFILGLLLLRKLLLQYFTDYAVGITLLAIGAGTNLIHYLTVEAPMSHGYNFFLFILFLYVLWKWREKTNLANTVYLGLVTGLISLIRPTNTLVVILIPLYGASSLKGLKTNLQYLIGHWKLVILMAFLAFLVWIPQLVYWKYIAGTFFYNSYENAGSSFFFDNPQFFNILFSYKKGWFIYTPVMLLATIGIVLYIRQKGFLSWGVAIYFLLNLYILASWWSWWFGGGFSNRAFIDSYGLMAFPLAALIDHFRDHKIWRWIITRLIVLLTAFTFFQAQQYRNSAIHWFWMNKEAYWETFLKLNPTPKYWNVLNQPDITKARKGIYNAVPIYDHKITREDLYLAVRDRFLNDTAMQVSFFRQADSTGIDYDILLSRSIDRFIDLGKATEEYKSLRIQLLKSEMMKYPSWREEIEKKADDKGISIDSMSGEEAGRIYKTYSQKYIELPDSSKLNDQYRCRK